MIIAIDGPAGSGKTTTAQKVANSLGFLHINTGAMYRAVTLKIINQKIDINNFSALNEVLLNTTINFSGINYDKIFLDGVNVTCEIATNKINKIVSSISAIKNVRNKLVECQRGMAKDKDVVLEGRDIGTVVFPEADLKFFLIADIKVRANRRKNQMKSQGEELSLKEIIDLLKKRDKEDSLREHSPLIKAEDAIELDTSNLTIDGQVDRIINIINNNQTGA